VPVLVVDDSEVAQTALCAVVTETPGLKVIGVASSAREALTLVGLIRPSLTCTARRADARSGRHRDRTPNPPRSPRR